MNVKAIPYVVGGTLFLALLLLTGFLYSEVKETNRRMGSLETSMKTIADVNKQNLADFLKSKEFQTVVENLRVDQVTIVREILSSLDKKLDDYQRASQEDPEVKEWDGIPVPAWIINKNQREAQGAQGK